MESNVFDILQKERIRQDNCIELIPSENYVSQAVMQVVGSEFTNKYAEGYPGKRYYGGCEYVDELEEYCKNKWLEAFELKDSYHINVQPHSGSQANMAAYMAVMRHGDTILSMSLEQGGHLTHGSKVNFSGKDYHVIHYGVDKYGYLDYVDMYDKLVKYDPKLLVAGASAYTREIDFNYIRSLIDKYNYEYDKKCLFMVDMSHIAGLVLAHEHASPFGSITGTGADIVTTTTHKTLRGPRGALIFCKPWLAKSIDSAVFPGVQGGPLMHVIAGKAVAAEEAYTDSYHHYVHQVVINAKALARSLKDQGFHLVTGGTDNHMILINLPKSGIDLTGKEAQDFLEKYNIIVNKNMIPGDQRKPQDASGIRLGTPAMTTRGWREEEFYEIGEAIGKILGMRI